MTISDVINLCLTIVTIIIASIALLQTHKQTKLSNKQQLFDRRLEQFHLVKELLSLYEKERFFLKDKTIVEKVDAVFIFLTNNSRLESMASVMSNPLGQEEKINFLKKCEVLEKSAIEITLIWKEKFAKDMSKFITQYVALLKALHNQQIIIKNMQNEDERKINIGQCLQLDEYKRRLDEWAERNKLVSTIQLIDDIFEEIKESSAEQKLVESLMLK